MCGLIGVLGRVDRARVWAGVEAVRGRGRDGDGVWFGDGVALGHTRLAIRDVAGGSQPMSGEDGSVVAVVNGEFYGMAPVRRWLEDRGHRFRSASDSEVVIHLYEEAGEDGLLRLEGEFALLLWDNRRRRLVGVRDPFGVRPLLWAKTSEGVFFASTARGLRGLGVPLHLSTDALLQAFHHQYLRPGCTLWAGVSALRPGWMLIADEEGITEHPWREAPRPSPGSVRAGDGVANLREALRAAVHDRLDADVPVGFQLSGGIDSAAVLALGACETRDPQAFTVAFPGARDESQDAAEAAAALGARLHVVPASPEALLGALPEAVAESGGLCINGHGAAKLLLARAARAEGVKVLLTGEGADELLFGYVHLLADWLGPDADLGSLNHTTAGVHLASGAMLPLGGVAAQLGFVPSFLAAKASLGHRARRLLHPDLRAASSSRDLLAELCAHDPPPPGLARVDVSAWLWTRLCLSGSILAVLNDPVELLGGVEGRLPFLDHRVVAVAMGLAHEAKVSGGHGKYALRVAMEGLLPDAVRWRPKRPFMAPPLAGHPAFRTMLLDLLPAKLFDRRATEEALEVWPTLPPAEQVAWDAPLMLALSTSILANEVAS